ncbi:YdcF family protein [Streptomyces carpaticus]|uniref:YdcF family protein n=1 Tax=Streptomyces TaxID=1883 RepID=UPI0022004357|nr:YdcF family protein [Streptomyces carpaticus]
MITDRVRADARRLWTYHRMGHTPRPCDVLIGLGSHDIGVAEAAAALYLRGLAPVVLFTGGNSPTTRQRMPRGEAVHYRERARELGVPADAILTEQRASNTGENIDFSRSLLREAGLAVSSVLLVSKPYEERRAYATVGRRWPEVTVVSASAPVTYEGYAASLGDERLVIDMLVGTLHRLLVYPAKGFVVAMPVPEEVLAAFERLRAAGFTSRITG